MRKRDSLVATYIYLAVGCGLLGVVTTYLLLLASQYFGFDVYRNLWVLALPVTVSVLLNVLLVELYHRHRKR